MFNEAFDEHKDIKLSSLNDKIKPILIQIGEHINQDRFNHYRPANALAQRGKHNLSTETLDNFELVIKDINNLFGY